MRKHEKHRESFAVNTTSKILSLISESADGNLSLDMAKANLEWAKIYGTILYRCTALPAAAAANVVGVTERTLYTWAETYCGTQGDGLNAPLWVQKTKDILFFIKENLQ